MLLAGGDGAGALETSVKANRFIKNSYDLTPPGTKY